MDSTPPQACLAHLCETQQLSRCWEKKKKKCSQCYVVCKIVNVTFHHFYPHTVQNTNRNKSRRLRFKVIIAMFLKILRWSWLWCCRQCGNASRHHVEMQYCCHLQRSYSTFEILEIIHPMTQHHIPETTRNLAQKTVLSQMTCYSYRDSSCVEFHHNVIQLGKPEHHWANYTFYFTLLH